MMHCHYVTCTLRIVLLRVIIDVVLHIEQCVTLHQGHRCLHVIVTRLHTGLCYCHTLAHVNVIIRLRIEDCVASHYC